MPTAVQADWRGADNIQPTQAGIMTLFAKMQTYLAGDLPNFVEFDSLLSLDPLKAGRKTRFMHVYGRAECVIFWRFRSMRQGRPKNLPADVHERLLSHGLSQTGSQYPKMVQALKEQSMVVTTRNMMAWNNVLPAEARRIPDAGSRHVFGMALIVWPPFNFDDDALEKAGIAKVDHDPMDKFNPYLLEGLQDTAPVLTPHFTTFHAVRKYEFDDGSTFSPAMVARPIKEDSTYLAIMGYGESKVLEAWLRYSQLDEEGNEVDDPEWFWLDTEGLLESAKDGHVPFTEAHVEAMIRSHGARGEAEAMGILSKAIERTLPYRGLAAPTPEAVLKYVRVARRSLPVKGDI